MTPAAPCDFHPDLTEGRLVEVAGLIAAGRDSAIEIYDPARGFDGWLLGCCAYRFGRFGIERAAAGEERPWLTLTDGTRHFTFCVGGAMVRFYRDDPEEPSAKVLRRSELEARQISFDLADEVDDLVFRFVVETGIGGELIRIVFLALRGSATELFWPVPIRRDGVRAPLVPVGPAPRDDGVALEAPVVTVRRRSGPGTASG